jgi:hypothetical protein
MDGEGIFDGGRAAGDRVGSGNTTTERDSTRSLGQLGSGGDRVGGSSNLERGHKQPTVGLGLGSGTAADRRTDFGAARPRPGQGELKC